MIRSGNFNIVGRLFKAPFFWAALLLVAQVARAGSSSIYPRVITPNGDGINDLVFFIVDNRTAAPSRGSIYNAQMLKVADVRESSVFVADSSVLVWDGKDESGGTVSAGIYLYKIQVGDDSYTGTVGVAR